MKSTLITPPLRRRSAGRLRQHLLLTGFIPNRAASCDESHQCGEVSAARPRAARCSAASVTARARACTPAKYPASAASSPRVARAEREHPRGTELDDADLIGCPSLRAISAIERNMMAVGDGSSAASAASPNAPPTGLSRLPPLSESDPPRTPAVVHQRGRDAQRTIE